MSGLVKSTVVVGTRESVLARWQTDWVVARLKAAFPQTSFVVKPVKTQGDKILDVALAKIGDKGLFTKELELALLQGEIDLAVHSLKDVPTVLPPGLTIGAICERADWRDVLISRHPGGLAALPAGARLGTSSLRRKAQLWRARPDLQLVDIRGNLQTRWRKMATAGLDGIILAAAGVLRLGWAEKISQYLPGEICLPAVGQGAIGVEIREGDRQTTRMVACLHHLPTALCVRAERALLRVLEGGCQIPIAALGSLDNTGELVLAGLVASLDGQTVCQGREQGTKDQPEELGKRLAARLLAQGAGAILEQVKQESGR